MTPLDDFLAAFNRAIEDGRFSSLVLSKNLPVADDLRSVRVRKIGLRGAPALSFVYHHEMRDVTQNLDLTAGPVAVAALLDPSGEPCFAHATLHAGDEELQLRISRKGRSNDKARGLARSCAGGAAPVGSLAARAERTSAWRPFLLMRSCNSSSPA